MPAATALPEPSAQAAFRHLQGAHCESGVMTALLRDKGLPITEAMVFGLASALSFCYYPFVKINDLPLISYRMTPRYIMKGLKRLLRLPLRFETFDTPGAGARRLDELLAQDRLVGLQASVYFLPFVPVNVRFHFNAHNFVAYGRDPATGEYLISDPILATASRCAPADLERARFARGSLAPRGLVYYIDGALPDTGIAQVAPLLRPAIRKNAFMMLWMPLPFVGTPGIRLLASRVRRLPARKDPDFCRRFASHIVRMQEIVGTGGAGFRFLYAAFLQEAAGLLDKPALHDLSLELTTIGDEWRQFGMLAARQNKGRDPLDPAALAAVLDDIAVKERVFFKKLWKAA